MQINTDFGAGAIAVPDASTPETSTSVPPTPISAALTDGTATSPGFDLSPGRTQNGDDDLSGKAKQKRNKPTLSCLECGK